MRPLETKLCSPRAARRGARPRGLGALFALVATWCAPSWGCADPDREEAAPRPAESSPSATSTVTVATSSAVDAAPSDGPELMFTRARITRALEADLADAVGPAAAAPLAQVVKRVLVWWINPRRDLRKGDRLDLVWSPQGEREPVVWAVWFQSEKLGEERAAVLHRPEGAPFARWVDPEGVEVPLRLERSPVATYEQITSLVNDGRGHRGVDFKAPEGTPVLAPFSGVIERVNWSTRSNGRCIKLRDPRTGREAIFLHLSRVAKGVRPGTRVAASDLLGYVGNTGRSFAPHLHYQLEKGGRVLDPFRVHDTFRARLDAEERRAAQARLLLLESMRPEVGG